MRVALVSTFDQLGGAGRAALRLHRALAALGVDSHLIVQEKQAGEVGVDGPDRLTSKGLAKLRPFVDELPLRLRRRREDSLFSLSWLPTDVRTRVGRLSADVVNLHWVGRGFVPIEAVPTLGSRIVWTLHDSWPFTGGCHLPFDCRRYRESCGCCPRLGSSWPWDLSRLTWLRKQRAWRGLDPVVVAPSRWLAECARSSSLFHDARIEVIPNALDLDIYRPIDKREARALLALPLEKKLILFGALNWERDRNKGAHLLREALERLGAHGRTDDLALVAVGADENQVLDGIAVPMFHVGRLHDDISLALVSSAADVFVAPSLLENLPYSVMEALACGTPSVAFDTGGISDLIKHQRNGYLARPFDPDDLARGLVWVLEDELRRRALAEAARRGCQDQFGAAQVAARYEALYRGMLSDARHTRGQGAWRD